MFTIAMIFLCVMSGGQEVLGASPCREDLFDAATSQILIFGVNAKEPVTREAHLANCKNTSAAMEYATQHVDKCVNGISKGIAKLFLEGAGSVVHLMCNDKKEDYLRLMPCLVKKSGRGINRCNRQNAAIMEGVADVKKKYRVAQACCSVGGYIDCVAEKAKVCGEEHEEYARTVVKTYAGELVDAFCGSWTAGSEACTELPRLKAAAKPRYKTLLPALVHTFNSLSN